MKPKLSTHASAGGSSLAKARGRAFAATDGAFMAAMPAEERCVARATLRAGLKELSAQMEQAARSISEYLMVKAELTSMDDKAIEESYYPDIRLAIELEAILEAGYEPQDFPKFRRKDVGFRLACSCWDSPELW